MLSLDNLSSRVLLALNDLVPCSDLSSRLLLCPDLLPRGDLLLSPNGLLPLDDPSAEAPSAEFETVIYSESSVSSAPVDTTDLSSWDFNAGPSDAMKSISEAPGPLCGFRLPTADMSAATPAVDWALDISKSAVSVVNGVVVVSFTSAGAVSVSNSVDVAAVKGAEAPISEACGSAASVEASGSFSLSKAVSCETLNCVTLLWSLLAKAAIVVDAGRRVS